MFLYDTGGWPVCLCITQLRGQYDCIEYSWVACMFLHGTVESVVFLAAVELQVYISRQTSSKLAFVNL